MSLTAGQCTRGEIRSVDHVVRARQQRGRDDDAEGLRGRAVDDELELGWPMSDKLAA
jgi:hypothetical protein